MINAPCVPTAALHPQPHTSVAEGETPRHSSIRVSFSPFILRSSFCFLLVDIVPIFFIICGHHVTCRLALLLVLVLMVMEAKQSPLSWCSAIRLCWMLLVHASRQEEEAAKGGEKDQIYLTARDRVDVRPRQISFP